MQRCTTCMAGMIALGFCQIHVLMRVTTVRNRDSRIDGICQPVTQRKRGSEADLSSSVANNHLQDPHCSRLNIIKLEVTSHILIRLTLKAN
jgi:hypothetical protein